MFSHRHIWQAVGACALAAAIAACGASSPSSTPSPSSSSTSSASTVATITANWVEFFSAQTPVATRISLLQDGSQFPKAALEPTGLAAGVSSKVLKVTNVTATQATVTYDVLLANTPALTNKKGVAVYQDGTWKVGVASFCGLLSLEVGSKHLPPVCKTS